jgi:hypothetical protein
MEKEIRKRELKERKLKQSRSNYEKLLEANKNKLLTKIEVNEERIKKQKKEQEQKKQKKYNKLYMLREDRKDRVKQYEKIQMFERRMKLEQINNRMEKIEEMQKERYLLDEERRKMEEEMKYKKSVMLNRLSKIIRSNEPYTKEEIADYVFKNIKPHTTKSMINTSNKFQLYNDTSENEEDRENKEGEHNEHNTNSDENNKKENINNNNNKENKKETPETPTDTGDGVFFITPSESLCEPIKSQPTKIDEINEDEKTAAPVAISTGNKKYIINTQSIFESNQNLDNNPYLNKKNEENNGNTNMQQSNYMMEQKKMNKISGASGFNSTNTSDNIKCSNFFLFGDISNESTMK